MPDLSHLCPPTDPGDPSTLAGWIGLDQRNLDIQATIPQLRAADFAAPVQPDKPILLYRGWYDVLGQYPPYLAQQIGDCVSHGHGHANDLLQCIEIAFGEPTEYRETDTEFAYASGRKVAGILGNSDGSYGSAQVKAMLQVGSVSREMLGNQGAYSGQRAKLWGKTGPPQAVELLAAPYRLGHVSKITTREQAISCLWNASTFTICSDQGFTMERDQNGFCRPKGSWAHCMFVAGWRPPPLEGFLICQSWGPNTPEGPLDLDQPDFSFWCDVNTMVRILRQGDSWGLFKSPDFVKRAMPPDWTQA